VSGVTTRVTRRLDDALFGPESPARLWFVHTALAVLIGIRIVAGPYRQLAPTPDGLFRPVRILSWLPGMPSAAAIGAVQIVGGLAVVAFLFRRWPRATFAIAWGCYLVLAGLRGSRGKILHNDVLLLLSSVPFLAAPLDVDRHEQAPDRRCGWPIRTAICVPALAYFFSGYQKLGRAGLSWITSDNVRFAVAWGPNPAVPRWNALADAVDRYAIVGHAIAAVTIAIEITYLLVIFFPRVRVGYAIGSTVLHVSTYFIFGLDYWAWIGVVWILFVDWPAVALRWSTRRKVAPQPA
jgi:hypothetical protein